MPVAPVFAYIGTALGATAATAVSTGVAATATVASVGLTAYSTIQAKRAADTAGQTAQQIADYNARLDRTEAEQVNLDAQENIRSLRRDAAVYMSRQTSAYVAAGVMPNTGSPLAVRAATAGRFELQAQQLWADSQAKQQRLESAAQVGIAEGAAKADAYHREGVAAVMGGVGRVAGKLYGAYNAGTFGGGSGVGTGTTDLSKDLLF